MVGDDAEESDYPDAVSGPWPVIDNEDKVVDHVRRLITDMIEGVIESSRGGEIKVDLSSEKVFADEKGSNTFTEAGNEKQVSGSGTRPPDGEMGEKKAGSSNQVKKQNSSRSKSSFRNSSHLIVTEDGVQTVRLLLDHPEETMSADLSESSVSSSEMNTNSNSNSQSVTNTDSNNSDSNSVIENSNQNRMSFQNNTHKITTVNGKMTVFRVVNGSVVFEEPDKTTTLKPTTVNSTWVMPVLGHSASTRTPEGSPIKGAETSTTLESLELSTDGKLRSTVRTTQRPTRPTTRLTPRRTTRSTMTTTTLPPGIMEAMNEAVNRASATIVEVTQALTAPVYLLFGGRRGFGRGFTFGQMHQDRADARDKAFQH